MSEYEYFGTPLTDLDVSGVLEGDPYIRAFLDANSNSPHLARIIREVECENIALIMDGTGDVVIDAILSRPDQRFSLQIWAIGQGDMDRIMGVLTNLISLTFMNAESTPVYLPALPPSLTELQLYTYQVRDEGQMEQLVDLERLAICPSGSPTPAWASVVERGILAMRRLTHVSLDFPLNVDPLPILLAMPPTVVCASVTGLISPDVYISFIQAGSRPNLKYFRVNGQLIIK